MGDFSVPAPFESYQIWIICSVLPQKETKPQIWDSSPALDLNGSHYLDRELRAHSWEYSLSGA